MTAPFVKPNPKSATQFKSLSHPRGHMVGEVDSHHPFPEHQQVSSGGALRRNERTFLESPRLNASDNFDAVSSSRAPAQGMIITGQTKRASNRSFEVRVIRNMPPAPGMPPGPSVCVRGNSKRPFVRNASSQLSNGAVPPALTHIALPSRTGPSQHNPA